MLTDLNSRELFWLSRGQLEIAVVTEGQDPRQISGFITGRKTCDSKFCSIINTLLLLVLPVPLFFPSRNCLSQLFLNTLVQQTKRPAENVFCVVRVWLFLSFLSVNTSVFPPKILLSLIAGEKKRVYRPPVGLGGPPKLCMHVSMCVWEMQKERERQRFQECCGQNKCLNHKNTHGLFIGRIFDRDRLTLKCSAISKTLLKVFIHPSIYLYVHLAVCQHQKRHFLSFYQSWTNILTFKCSLNVTWWII